MRRFPAPPPPVGVVPGGGGDNDDTVRTTEAPMQYEWEKPRQFPTSLFSTPDRRVDRDGERAKKRTHYEAMDVDTPPQPPSNLVESTTTGAGGGGIVLEPLRFDAKRDFDRQSAFGLDQAVKSEEVVMADDAEQLVENQHDVLPRAENEADEGETGKSLVLTNTSATTRRRNENGKSKRPPTGVTIETDEEEGEEGEREDLAGSAGRGFLSAIQKKRGGGGEFSFQVHHHHAPPLSPSGTSLTTGNAFSSRERWLQSNTPYVLLGYLQFGSLTLFALLVLSLLFLFLYTLYTDIQTRLSTLTLELRSDILQCAKAYVDNRCEPLTRIPAMERKCSEWEECMNREVVVVGKTRVVAETLAEIVNGFVDVISFKTMLFVLLTLGITIYGSSAALALLSSRATNHHQPQHYYPPPYGLPYNAGRTPWVIENGAGGGGGVGGGEGQEGPVGMGTGMLQRRKRE